MPSGRIKNISYSVNKFLIDSVAVRGAPLSPYPSLVARVGNPLPRIKCEKFFASKKPSPPRYVLCALCINRNKMKMPRENIQYVSIMDYGGEGYGSESLPSSGARDASVNKSIWSVWDRDVNSFVKFVPWSKLWRIYCRYYKRNVLESCWILL